MDDKYFVDENLIKTKTYFSDNEKYKLIVNYYRTGTPEDHYWNYTRGLLYSAHTNELLVDIKRNYSSFWYLFVEHPNGNEYFLCGRNYHGGYSIFDLTNHKEYEHIPKPKYEFSQFFCWVEAKFLDNQELVVYGCYWGAPFEFVRFDFSDPTNIPLPELGRRDEDDDDE